MMDRFKEIDLQKIHNELTDGFAKVEYEKYLYVPYMKDTTDKITPWMHLYQTDSYFSFKVKSIVHGCMTIIERNIK